MYGRHGGVAERATSSTGFVLSVVNRSFAELEPLLAQIVEVDAPAVVGVDTPRHPQCESAVQSSTRARCITLQTSAFSMMAKFMMRLRSPFKYSLQLDSDTRICINPKQALQHVSHMLEPADVLARPVSTSVFGPESNFVPRLSVRFKPQGGVLAWKNTPDTMRAWRDAMRHYVRTRQSRWRDCNGRSLVSRSSTVFKQHCRGSEQDALAIALREHRSNVSVARLPSFWNCKEPGREQIQCCSDGCAIDHHCAETMRSQTQSGGN
jgi:hypothetical protein